MINRSATACRSSDGVLDQLLEEITGRIQAGESLDVESCVAGHPEYADQLRRLLPAMQMLAAAGGSPGDTAAMPHQGLVNPATGVLGDFRIVREIGRGGMGVVYEAEQISIGRSVALKVLPFASIVDERRLARFRNEVRAAGQLHHTNIVPIYAVGADRGIHFFAMQLVDGQTVAEIISGLRGQSGAAAANDAPTAATGQTALAETERAALSTVRSDTGATFCRTAAQLAADAAEALEHAHSHGVIHRDIKPSNLMVDARGTLYLTDFGLATMESDSNLTMTGDLLGTLRYMSPEQTRGLRVVLDHRTDVYSLGVTLYELLTLELAFDAPDRQQLVQLITDADPRAPRRLNAAIPADLETIVLKAMAKEPVSRYASAKEMADDLHRFLANKPIEARRPTLVERARQWSRRHAALVGMGVAALAAAAVVGVGAAALMLRAYRSEAHQRAAAEASLQLAAESIDRMLSRVAGDRKAFGDLAHAETLAVDATEFYERLLRQGRNPELVYRAAEAYKQIGVIWIAIGQYEKAAGAHRRAKELLTPLAVPDGRAEHQAALAENYMNRAEIDWSLDEYESADGQWRSALAIYEQLSRQHPQETEYDVGVSNALGNLGLTCWATKHLGEAEILFARSMALEAALPDELKCQPDYWESRGTTLNNWAMLVRERGEYDRALKMFEDSIALQQRAFAAWHADPAEHSCYLNAHWNIAATHAAAGRHAAAAAAVERLVAACPRNLRSYVSGAELLLDCAQLAKDDDDAADAYRRRTRELLTLADGAPDSTATAKDRYAWFLVTCEDGSFRNTSRAIELAEQVVKEVPERGPAWFTLALARYRNGEWPAAERALENSVRFSVDRRANTFDWLLLAMIRSQQGQADEAHKWHDKANAWIAAHEPTDKDVLRLTAEADGVLKNRDP